MIKRIIQNFLSVFGIRVIRSKYKRKYLPKSNIENIQLIVHLFDHFGKEVTLLQIGACDGFTSDSIYPYVKRGSINAYLVEPVPSNFNRLKEFYKDAPSVTFINAAVSDIDEKRTVYSIKEEGRWRDDGWARQLASFYKQHLLKHGIKESEILEQAVVCKTLKTIVDEYKIEGLEVLLVDTEGYDAEIIKMAFKQGIRPNFIVFENAQIIQNYSQNELDEFYQLIDKNGYYWTHDRINSLAIKKEFVQLGI